MGVTRAWWGLAAYRPGPCTVNALYFTMDPINWLKGY